jgi:hypothetical protein
MHSKVNLFDSHSLSLVCLLTVFLALLTVFLAWVLSRLCLCQTLLGSRQLGGPGISRPNHLQQPIA